MFPFVLFEVCTSRVWCSLKLVQSEPSEFAAFNYNLGHGEYVPLVSTYYHLREFRYVVPYCISYYIIRLTQGLVQQSWPLLIAHDHFEPDSGKRDQWNCFEINKSTSGPGSTLLEAPYLDYAASE